MLDAVQSYLLKHSFGETEMLEAEDKARARITRLLSGEAPEEYGPATPLPNGGAVETEDGLITYPGLGPPVG